MDGVEWTTGTPTELATMEVPIEKLTTDARIDQFAEPTTEAPSQEVEEQIVEPNEAFKEAGEDESNVLDSGEQADQTIVETD